MKKQTVYLDASALAKSSCFLRLYRIVVEGWTQESRYNDTELGSAFAKFKEALMHSDGSQMGFLDSIRIAQEYFRDQNPRVRNKKDHLDINYLTILCQKYVDKFGIQREKDNFQIFRNTEGKPQVEAKFGIPYYVDDLVQIVLTGTMDGLGKFQPNGCVAIEDDKTTSSWKKEEYLHAYKLSPQLLMYRLVVDILAEKMPSGNIFQRLLSESDIGCFITAAFLNPDISKIEFKRSQVMYFSRQQLMEYHNLLDLTVRRLAEAIRQQQELPEDFLLPRQGMVNGSCQTPYGLCQFFNVCSAPEGAQEAMLSAHFTQKKYEPLNFR